jgi:hypothetical protein
MARRKKAKNKFEFGTDFQELILQYTVTDPKGFKALELYNDSNFALIHHSIIAYTLKKYYKKYKHIPEETNLREFLRNLLETDKGFKADLTPDDRETVYETISRIYSDKVSNPDIIIEKCVTFARYVAFKDVLENVDLTNYDSYSGAIKEMNAANNLGFELTEKYGTFLVKDMPDRAHKRDSMSIIFPTPFWQMNKLLNSGGTEKGNVIVVLGKEKDFKTGVLINTGRGFMKMRKKVFFVDLENGEIAITVRSEQSIANREQELIRSGDYDNQLLKIFRKYKRIGSEMGIKRFPSLTTTCDVIQVWLDRIKRDLGITFDVGIIDYGFLLGATSGKKDDFGRISDAFLDIKNLADYNGLDTIWTAAHVKREGSDKRRKYVFTSNDIAKCIDVPRHVDALLGMQQNEEEEEAGVLRLEVVEQRNGMRNGKMLFWVDIPKQRMKEFTKAEVKEYYKELGKRSDDDGEKPKRTRTRKTDL